MPETILITGASGTLGRAVTPLLLAQGHAVRLVDLITPVAPAYGQTLTGDLRDEAFLIRAVHGVDAIVHAAAWHGIHLRDHPPADFWALNVDVTLAMYEAALAAGVDRIVLASTMGVYGASRTPGDDGAAVRLHEQLPLQPVNVYELSKAVAEEIAASYDRRAPGIRSIALRFGMFVPEPFLHAGIRFLYGGVDERDVAAATVAALDRLRTAVRGSFAAYNVMSALPYTEADGQALRADPMAVIARHWSHAAELMRQAGVEPWGPIHEWYDITAAEGDLGWRPHYGFSEFLSALREGRPSL